LRALLRVFFAGRGGTAAARGVYR